MIWCQWSFLHPKAWLESVRAEILCRHWKAGENRRSKLDWSVSTDIDERTIQIPDGYPWISVRSVTSYESLEISRLRQNWAKSDIPIETKDKVTGIQLFRFLIFIQNLPILFQQKSVQHFDMLFLLYAVFWKSDCEKMRPLFKNLKSWIPVEYTPSGLSNLRSAQKCSILDISSDS